MDLMLVTWQWPFLPPRNIIIRLQVLTLRCRFWESILQVSGFTPKTSWNGMLPFGNPTFWCLFLSFQNMPHRHYADTLLFFLIGLTCSGAATKFHLLVKCSLHIANVSLPHTILQLLLEVLLLWLHLGPPPCNYITSPWSLGERDAASLGMLFSWWNCLCHHAIGLQ